MAAVEAVEAAALSAPELGITPREAAVLAAQGAIEAVRELADSDGDVIAAIEHARDQSAA